MATIPDANSAPARRPGRPRSSATPEAIRRAAASLFGEHGFSGTSVRGIATLAGCDPAVVIRHFGSKEELFLEVLTVAPQFDGLVDGPLDTLGRTILEKLVSASNSILKAHATLLGALDRGEVRRYLEQSTARSITEPLAARLTGPDPELRAQLVAAQIGGLLMSICLSESTPTSLLGTDALRYYANALQAIIDSPDHRK